MASKYVNITAAATDTTIHQVTPGRTCVVKGIIITNNNASDVNVKVYDGASANGDVKLSINVGPNETFALDEVKPEFIDSVVVVSSLANVEVMIEYEEE